MSLNKRISVHTAHKTLANSIVRKCTGIYFASIIYIGLMITSLQVWPNTFIRHSKNNFNISHKPKN